MLSGRGPDRHRPRVAREQARYRSSPGPDQAARRGWRLKVALTVQGGRRERVPRRQAIEAAARSQWPSREGVTAHMLDAAQHLPGPRAQATASVFTAGSCSSSTASASTVPTPGVNAKALAGAFEPAGRDAVRPLRPVRGRRVLARDHLRAQDHAVHLVLDHPPAARRAWCRHFEKLRKEGDEGQEEAHAVHALRHGLHLDRPVAAPTACSSSTWARRAG